MLHGKKKALGVLAASAVAAAGVMLSAGGAHAAPVPLSVTLNSCGTGNSATFNGTGNLVLKADKDPGAGLCGTSYNTAGVGYADASVDGAAGSSMPAAAPAFTVTGDTQSDYVFDFEMTNGDRVWGFANGTWTAFHGGVTLAPTGTYASVLAAVGLDTVKSAMFFVSGDAAFPDSNVVVSGVQYNNQTLNGGGAVTLATPANVDNVLGTAITPVHLNASTNTTDKHLTYSAANLPNGLAIDAATGVVSGSPTATGGSLVTVKAANDYGQSASASFNVVVTSAAAVPFVLNGMWTSRTAATATVSWDESAAGWPSKNKCQEVYITGFGFGPLGDFTHAHVGFTCDNGAGHNTGYLRGLEPNQTYALRIVPATGTYGSHQPISGAPTGYVDVFTLADF